MSAKLLLTARDIQEMLSSTLLAEMNYQQKLDYCQGQSLADDFLPETKILKNLEHVLERIATLFDIKSTLLTGKNISAMAEIIFEQTKGIPQTLTFFTSGSTGEPIPARSHFKDLEQEICSLARLFPSRRRVLSFVPRHHIYGFLFSLLLPKALNIPVEYTAPLPTTDQIRQMRSGDLIIAFPLLWKKLEKLRSQFPENVYGVTSTGPCPAETINGLKLQNLARMTEIYGSSETGGVGFRHDPAKMYSLFEHWQPNGTSTIERTSADGSKQQHILQDNLEWQDRLFKPLKRADKAVQVGGINVYPARVEELFKKCPQVKECSVRLMRPEEGERLKAFIVPAKEIEQAKLERALRALAATELSRHEKPGKYDFGTALPVSEIGKMSDW